MSDQPNTGEAHETETAPEGVKEDRAAKIAEMRKPQEPDVEKVLAAVNTCNEALKGLTTAEKARFFNSIRSIHFNI